MTWIEIGTGITNDIMIIIMTAVVLIFAFTRYQSL